MVKEHALAYPENVMEQPQVSVNIYPETGESRVVELKFTYETNRDTLKDMQNQVYIQEVYKLLCEVSNSRFLLHS